MISRRFYWSTHVFWDNCIINSNTLPAVSFIANSLCCPSIVLEPWFTEFSSVSHQGKVIVLQRFRQLNEDQYWRNKVFLKLIIPRLFSSKFLLYFTWQLVQNSQLKFTRINSSQKYFFSILPAFLSCIIFVLAELILHTWSE